MRAPFHVFLQWRISLALHIRYTEKSGRQTYSCVRAQSLNIASDMPKDFSGNIRLVQNVHRSEECAHKEVEVKQTFEVCTQELNGNLNLNLIAIMMARDWERAKKRVTRLPPRILFFYQNPHDRELETHFATARSWFSMNIIVFIRLENNAD